MTATLMAIYTERLRADKILVCGWIVWIACVIVMPISPVFYGDLQSTTLFIVSNLAVWIGLRAFDTQSHANDAKHFVERAHNTLRVLVPLGFLALLIRIADYFALRGVPLFASFSETRQFLETSQPNLASAAFGLLSPAILAAGIFGMFCAGKGYRSGWVIAAILLLLSYPAFSFLVGGRSTLALVGILAIFAFVLSVPRLNRRNIIILFLVLTVAIIITMKLFIGRLLESELNLAERVNIAGYNQLVPLNDWVLIATRDAHPVVAGIVLYFLSLGQYVAHGVFEFFALIKEKNPGDPLLWGQYEFLVFDQLAKVISGVFGGEVPKDLEIYNPRSGLYTTFWGPAFLDFQYFIPMYSLIFGILVSYFQKRVSEGDVYALPLHCLFLFQIATSIMANGFLWAAAIFANVVFLGGWLALKLSHETQVVPE